MSPNGMTTTDLERSYQVISAINVLSIDCKIRQAGIENQISEAQLKEARSVLLAFIQQLQSIVREIGTNHERIIVGVDPRLGEFAQKLFMGEDSRAGKTKIAPSLGDDIIRLISNDRSEDLQALISSLRELRLLLEQYSQSDVNQVLGDL
jgi:hypothetical protein